MPPRTQCRMGTGTNPPPALLACEHGRSVPAVNARFFTSCEVLHMVSRIYQPLAEYIESLHVSTHFSDTGGRHIRRSHMRDARHAPRHALTATWFFTFARTTTWICTFKALRTRETTSSSALTAQNVRNHVAVEAAMLAVNLGKRGDEIRGRDTVLNGDDVVRHRHAHAQVGLVRR